MKENGCIENGATMTQQPAGAETWQSVFRGDRVHTTGGSGGDLNSSLAITTITGQSNTCSTNTTTIFIK